jgi:hypothetical protein
LGEFDKLMPGVESCQHEAAIAGDLLVAAEHEQKWTGCLLPWLLWIVSKQEKDN